MWLIEIPLPDDTKDDVIEAFGSVFHYPEEILDPETKEMVPNPITREEFVQDQLAYYILNITMNHIIQKAKVAAFEATNAIVEERAFDAITWYDQYRKDNRGQ